MSSGEDLSWGRGNRERFKFESLGRHGKLEAQKGVRKPQPSCAFAQLLPKPAFGCLERLDVRSLPTLGALHDVELHGLAFLQALEAA
jgi:hypothetical protein